MRNQGRGGHEYEMQVVAEAVICGYIEIKSSELLVWSALLAPKLNQEAGGLQSGVTTKWVVISLLTMWLHIRDWKGMRQSCRERRWKQDPSGALSLGAVLENTWQKNKARVRRQGAGAFMPTQAEAS